MLYSGKSRKQLVTLTGITKLQKGLRVDSTTVESITRKIRANLNLNTSAIRTHIVESILVKTVCRVSLAVSPLLNKHSACFLKNQSVGRIRQNLSLV